MIVKKIEEVYIIEDKELGISFRIKPEYFEIDGSFTFKSKRSQKTIDKWKRVHKTIGRALKIMEEELLIK